MKKPIAEFIGTMALVFFGCGAAVIGGGDGASGVGLTGISLAFGLAIVAMAYGIGPISGCHINPAVSLGVWIAGRMPTTEMFQYWVAQILGGIAGAAILYCILSGRLSGYDVGAVGLGQNGWGEGYLGEYSLHAALVFEVFATFLFLVTILGVTTPSAGTGVVAGLAIGLTLAAIHLVGIKVTGVSVNPARSFGPAVFVGGKALSQVWLFFVAPAIGAALAGFLFRNGMLAADKK